MKFVTYLQHDGVRRSGILQGDHIRPLTSTAEDAVLAYIRSGADHPALETTSLALTDIKLLAPLQHPPRIFGIGLNYVEHAAESKMKVQEVPTVFLKLTSSIAGPDEERPHPFKRHADRLRS